MAARKALRKRQRTPAVGGRTMELPKALRNESRLQHDPLYAIPAEMLEALGDRNGGPRLDARAQEVESRLTDHCERVGIVGYEGGRPVQYDLLRSTERDVAIYWDLMQQYNSRAGKPPPSADVHAELRRKLGHLANVPRGFAGWLVTNRGFLAERDTLYRRHHGAIDRYGLPPAGLTWMAYDPRRKPRGKHEAFLCELADFCVRWRLQGMAARDLPVPLGPQVPILQSPIMLRHLNAGGFGMFLPDTFPVPSRDELREIGTAIQAQRLPAHLAGWGKIIRRESDDLGVARYGNMLIVHHVLNALRSRHPRLFPRNIGRIDAAIAHHVGVDCESVRKLRTAIRRRTR